VGFNGQRQTGLIKIAEGATVTFDNLLFTKSVDVYFQADGQSCSDGEICSGAIDNRGTILWLRKCLFHDNSWDLSYVSTHISFLSYLSSFVFLLSELLCTMESIPFFLSRNEQPTTFPALGSPNYPYKGAIVNQRGGEIKEIFDTIFSGNEAEFGPAIHNSGEMGKIHGSTFLENNAKKVMHRRLFFCRICALHGICNFAY
jgi:hypothetical protein